MAETRITITQHGGFAGTVQRVAVDAGSLDEAGLREFDAARAELAALAGSPAAAGPEIGADLVHYEVEIDDGGAKERFRLGESAAGGVAPVSVDSIIARLERLGAGSAPSG